MRQARHHPLAATVLRNRLQEPRLADAGLALDQDDAAVGRRRPPGGGKGRQLAIAADERSGVFNGLAESGAAACVFASAVTGRESPAAPGGTGSGRADARTSAAAGMATGVGMPAGAPSVPRRGANRRPDGWDTAGDRPGDDPAIQSALADGVGQLRRL